MLHIILCVMLAGPTDFTVGGTISSTDTLEGSIPTSGWPNSEWEYWHINFVDVAKYVATALRYWELNAGANEVIQVAPAKTDGWLQIKTADDTDDYEVVGPRYAFFDTGFNLVAEVELYLDSDLEGKEVRVGFTDDPTLAAESQYCQFLFDYSNNNTYWYHNSDTGSDASLGVGPTADTAQTLKLVVSKTSGNAYFYIDGTLYATVAGAVGGATDMYFVTGVKTESDTNETIYVNKISLAWKD